MDVGSPAVGRGGVDDDACEQAVMRTAARMSKMNRSFLKFLGRLLNIQFSVAQPFHHFRVTVIEKTTCFCV